MICDHCGKPMKTSHTAQYNKENYDVHSKCVKKWRKELAEGRKRYEEITETKIKTKKKIKTKTKKKIKTKTKKKIKTKTKTKTRKGRRKKKSALL